MKNQSSDGINKSRLKKNKSSYAMNTLMNELYLMLLEMISTAIIDNEFELLLAFGIDEEIRKQLTDDLLSLGTEQQSQILEKIGSALFDFSIKDGAFNLNQQHTITEQRKAFRSTIDMHNYNINFKLLRLVSKAAHLYDEEWLKQFGIDFEEATNILHLGLPEQIKLVRDRSASKGLAINLTFNSQFFYLAHGQIQEQRTINSFINTLLHNKVDISRDSLKDYFGILPNEFSLRKRMLGQISKKGPKYQLTNEDAFLIDADWVKDISYFKNLYNDLDDEWRYISSELMKYYVLHRKYDIPIGSIISHNHNILNNK